MTEQTLLLIKPNATRQHHIGEIITIIERHGFEIYALKAMHFSLDLAFRFYEEHVGKEFYGRLINFMTSGLVIALVLRKEDAVHELRTLIGDTNPDKRAPGTIRALYADSVNENAVHASDSHDHAIREIGLIFPELRGCSE